MPLGSQKDKKAKSKATEKRIADELGGDVVVGSGAFLGNKGDVKMEDFLVEHKQTEGASFILQRSYITKIAKEAMGVNKEPLLIFTFLNMPKGTSRDWVCIPLDRFTEFLKD